MDDAFKIAEVLLKIDGYTLNPASNFNSDGSHQCWYDTEHTGKLVLGFWEERKQYTYLCLYHVESSSLWEKYDF